jgi:hypothetical protein
LFNCSINSLAHSPQPPMCACGHGGQQHGMREPEEIITSEL